METLFINLLSIVIICFGIMVFGLALFVCGLAIWMGVDDWLEDRRYRKRKPSIMEKNGWKNDSDFGNY